MQNKTPLYNKHVESNAKIVDFHGWLMPIHYGSQIEEHHAVRNRAGMFDVSHMMVTEVSGPDRNAFLSYLLANDIAKLEEEGQALYTLMLNEQGGILDDLIVYQCDTFFRLITNAGTREKIANWLAQQAKSFQVEIQIQDEVVMLAVQGPSAQDYIVQALGEGIAQKLTGLKKFHGFAWQNGYIAKTGYTGEPGAEILLPVEEGKALWDQLISLGVQPCGLGARDTLRLEAGLNLYGLDMDDSVLPGAANLAWTLSMGSTDLEADHSQRNFIGRRALLEAKAKELDEQIEERLIGLVIEGRGIPRSGQKVTVSSAPDIEKPLSGGVITSGSFSPTLSMGIAFARVSVPINGGACDYQVQIRNKSVPAKVVSLPFVKGGKKAFAVES